MLGLGCYGSSDEEGSEPEHSPSPPRVTAPPGPSGEACSSGSGGVGKPGGSLLSSLPAPRTAAPSGVTGGGAGLLGGLPPAKSGGSKKVVPFRLPMQKKLLEKAAKLSEGELELEGPRKRRKAAAPAGGGLLSFLPAPKNTGADIGSVLGGGRHGLQLGDDDGARPGPSSSHAAAVAPADDAVVAGGSRQHDDAVAGSNEAYAVGTNEAYALPVGNEAYAVAANEAYATQAGNEAYAVQAGNEAYAAHMGDPHALHAYGSDPSHGAVGPQGGTHMLEAAIQSSARRRRAGDALDGIQFTEVNADEQRSMDPAALAAAAAADVRNTLGPGYAAKVREEAGAEPSKLAKRKHQLNALFYQAKMSELEMGSGGSVKSKRETQAKYGWA